MVDQTSQFYAILTNVGAAKQANADALGIAWKITEMAVGDGNPGNVDSPALPQPSANWTALLNEWRRAPLNQLKVDDKDSSIIVAEQIIPADVGGRWIREIGLYDADGDLVAVANCAPTYKPLLSQGSGRTQVVRMNLIVSSSSNVQLKIDPSVVLATREWVEGELAKQDFKHSVLVATTAAIALSGLQTIDGVALSAGARVLVKNQAAAKDNGLYLVVAGGAWTRCTDADTSTKVTPGMLVLVERGTVNADSAWQLLTDAPITLGVTALDYGMAFGRTGVAAGTYQVVKVDAYGRVIEGGNPTTPAQFDATTKVATTEFVQRALGNFRFSVYNISASRALTVDDLGSTLATNTANNITLTLPNVSDVPGGAALHIYNQGSGTTSLVPTTNGGVIRAGNGSVATMVLLPGDTVTLVRVPGDGVWYALHGSVANRFSGAMKSAVWTTPPQFEATTKLATAEFVQRALGNHSGVLLLMDTVSLRAEHCGMQLVGSTGMAGKTVTLPPTSAIPAGATIHISAGANVTPMTVAAAAGDLIAPGVGGSTTSVQSFQMEAVDSVSLVSLGAAWRIVGGTQLNKHSKQFAGSTSTTSGVSRLPNGLMFQTGTVAHAAFTNALGVAISFPTAFPVACIGCMAISDAGLCGVDMNGFNIVNSSATVYSRDSGGMGVAGTLFWIAIGY
ncbi:hypothetical protein IAE37_005556 [Pseudomonas sp. S31]|uniref:phage tail protein n=1 Tax=Pseudomonas sp. S31 TaxID=1564473 RepID=UPI0019117FFF|nr:phage tail protein [Pseudomonas sp. S31]MBK5003280.1 hypothetical protein [Pseudomonas sp. S31]